MITMRNLLLTALVLSAGSAGAALWTATDNTVSAIPDGSSAGLARSLTINAAGQAITSVSISINISTTSGGTAFLGDEDGEVRDQAACDRLQHLDGRGRR